MAALSQANVLARSVVTSFQLDTVVDAATHGRPMRHVWLVLPQIQVDLGLDRIIAIAKTSGVPMLGLRQNMLDANSVAMVRKAGLGIGGWACNDAAAIIRLLDLEVDVFTTDRPDLALAQREARRKG
jgi:glycerophosphoryl diester phosphodiesterase